MSVLYIPNGNNARRACIRISTASAAQSAQTGCQHTPAFWARTHTLVLALALMLLLVVVVDVVVTVR